MKKMKHNNSKNDKRTANYIVPRQQEELSWHLNEFYDKLLNSFLATGKINYCSEEQELKELQTHR